MKRGVSAETVRPRYRVYQSRSGPGSSTNTVMSEKRICPPCGDGRQSRRPRASMLGGRAKLGAVASLDYLRELAGRDHGLAVVVTQRSDGSPQTSIANAGVLAHPVSGDAVVGLVVRGGTRKHENLRRRPRATVVFRAGWEWVAVEGPVDLAGPEDALPEFDAGRVPQLLR